MGVAAYNRGSRVISMQFHRERCRGCAECEGIKPTPRPADWGSKSVRSAADKARKLLAGASRLGADTPDLRTLADMVQMDSKWSVRVCLEAARLALEE